MKAEFVPVEAGVSFYTAVARQPLKFSLFLRPVRQTAHLFFFFRLFMAYAAYRDHLVAATPVQSTVFMVLEVVVPSVAACSVRRGIATCAGAGVLRCEPIIHPKASCDSAASRVRLMIRLPMHSYAAVLHCLLECAPDGEIGHLLTWRGHLRRHGVAYGGSMAAVPASSK